MELLIIIIIAVTFWYFKSKKNKNKSLPQQTIRPAPLPNNTQPTMSLNNKNVNQTTQISGSNSQDDDFASFTISVGRQAPESANKTIGIWVEENKRLIIQGRTLKRGFYYYGGKLVMLTGFGVEPSLVDESLPAHPATNLNSTSIPYSDDTLGYWPSYASLSPACRGVYLDWLASERINANMPIGYIFIYFAGFERRVIGNTATGVVSNEEFSAIFKEVVRLNKLYHTQRSFASYSFRFLEYMTLIRPALFTSDSELISLLPTTEGGSELRFRYKLAKKVAANSPISASLAWQWLNYSGEYTFKTPATRCEHEFETLFKIIYKDTYPSGLMVKPNKTKLKISYQSASRSISVSELEVNGLPDPSILKAPVKKLITIAEQCNDALDSYSRYLGREGNSKDDISAIILLPKKLIEHISPPIITNFSQWAQSIIKNQNGLTSTRSLWAHLKEPLPNSLTKKHNELLINLAELSGFGLAPDQRYHDARIKPDGNVVIFKGGHGEHFKPSESFNRIKLFLRLGAMVATIDGYVDEYEVNTLMKLINQDSSLNDLEKTSLASYLTWRLNSPTNMAGLKAKLAKFDDQHNSFISRFIISVALANGNIEPSQIKQIEKIYTALGLDKSRVSSAIHYLTSSKKVSSHSNPVPALSAKNDINSGKVTNTSPNTRNSNVNANPDSNTFSIDVDVLARHESETEDAKMMLASIFASDEDDWEENMEPDSHEQDTTEPNTADDASINDSQITGLDKPHSQLYRALTTRSIWSVDEVEALCEPLNLMINGAIETINDWAFDTIDAPVIYEDDEIEVDLEIVEELQTANE